MINIPNSIFIKYQAVLNMNDVNASYYTEYAKWLRYYLDFCAKHLIADDKSGRVRLFVEKLREKKQSDAQCKHAANAELLYDERLLN